MIWSISLIVFIFAGLFSPGPNVVLLTASGARFGFVQTLPHVAGVVIGVGVTAGLTGLGLGALLLSVPALTVALKIIAALWILYLAWRLLLATRTAAAQTQDRPFTFFEGVLFQWVNPKVWAVALGASAFVAQEGPWRAAITLAVAFSALNLAVCLFWSTAGHLMRRILTDESLWRGFMSVMAALMAFSALLVFL